MLQITRSQHCRNAKFLFYADLTDLNHFPPLNLSLNTILQRCSFAAFFFRQLTFVLSEIRFFYISNKSLKITICYENDCLKEDRSDIS